MTTSTKMTRPLPLRVVPGRIAEEDPTRRDQTPKGRGKKLRKAGAKRAVKR